MAEEITLIRMGPQGRIVVPASLRRELGLDEGSTLALSADHGRLVLEPRDEVLRRARARFAKVPSGVRLSDELIRDRVEESRRERRR
jgi:AbrB family looped-hinge helix DNA binding protein